MLVFPLTVFALIGRGLALGIGAAASLVSGPVPGFPTLAAISLAAGIIMGQNRCTHAEAMRILKDASNHRNVKLRELADDLVSSLDPDYLENHFRA